MSIKLKNVQSKDKNSEDFWPEWAPPGLRAPEAGIQAINLAWWVALIQLNPTESSGFGFQRF
jgi:hypothetical protein